MRTLSDLWSQPSFRWELAGGLLLTAGAVAGGAWAVAMPWPAALLIGLVYVGMYLYKQLHLTSGLYAVFLGLAVMGWIEWRRTLAKGTAPC